MFGGFKKLSYLCKRKGTTKTKTSMKQTKKQVKAQVINEVQKQFEHKLERMQASYNNLHTLLQNVQQESQGLCKENRKLKEENIHLKEKVEQYEEWIERMQDFCNLSEEERRPAFKTYLDGIKAKVDSSQALERLSKMFGSMASIFQY